MPGAIFSGDHFRWLILGHFGVCLWCCTRGTVHNTVREKMEDVNILCIVYFIIMSVKCVTKL